MPENQTTDSNSHFTEFQNTLKDNQPENQTTFPEFQNILKDNQFGTRFNLITTS